MCPRRVPMRHVFGRPPVGTGDYGYFVHVCYHMSVSAEQVSSFQLMICHFGMPAVIHSDQGREFENHLMQELCLLLGAHKTHTTPYHPASDGLVKRFNYS